MSFVPWCAAGTAPSVGDSGEEAFVRRSWPKESERKTSRKIVSLRVPGTVDYRKPSSAPGVIRICQEPQGQKKLPKKFNVVGFVIVPEPSDFGAPEKRQISETSASSSVPSIKRCSLDEIEAVNRPVERKTNRENLRENGLGGHTAVLSCTNLPSDAPGHRGRSSGRGLRPKGTPFSFSFQQGAVGTKVAAESSNKTHFIQLRKKK